MSEPTYQESQEENNCYDCWHQHSENEDVMNHACSRFLCCLHNFNCSCLERQKTAWARHQNMFNGNQATLRWNCQSPSLVWCKENYSGNQWGWGTNLSVCELLHTTESMCEDCIAGGQREDGQVCIHWLSVLIWTAEFKVTEAVQTIINNSFHPGSMYASRTVWRPSKASPSCALFMLVAMSGTIVWSLKPRITQILYIQNCAKPLSDLILVTTPIPSCLFPLFTFMWDKNISFFPTQFQMNNLTSSHPCETIGWQCMTLVMECKGLMTWPEMAQMLQKGPRGQNPVSEVGQPENQGTQQPVLQVGPPRIIVTRMHLLNSKPPKGCGWMPCRHTLQKILQDTGGNICPKHFCFSWNAKDVKESENAQPWGCQKSHNHRGKLENTQPCMRHRWCVPQWL